MRHKPAGPGPQGFSHWKACPLAPSPYAAVSSRAPLWSPALLSHLNTRTLTEHPLCIFQVGAGPWGAAEIEPGSGTPARERASESRRCSGIKPEPSSLDQAHP